MVKKLNESVYRTSELIELLGKRGIEEALKNDELYRLERGYYTTPNIPADMNGYFYAASKYYPEAVVSKNSALFYYGLSEHMPEKIDLDVPRESKHRPGNPLFDFHRISDSKIFNVVVVKIRDLNLKIYSPERALFEVLCDEPKARGDRTSYAVRAFVRREKVSIAELARVADRLKKCNQPGVYELLNLINVLMDDRSLH